MKSSKHIYLFTTDTVSPDISIELCNIVRQYMKNLRVLKDKLQMCVITPYQYVKAVDNLDRKYNNKLDTVKLNETR